MKYRRIAVISYHTCPLSDSEGEETGGLNVYVFGLCKQLAKKGYMIDIYTRSQDKNNRRIVEAAHNLRVIHIAAGKEEEIEKKKLTLYIPEFLTNMYVFINKNKAAYDLVYSHYYLSGIIGLRIKEKYKIPLFVTFHTLALMKNLIARDESEREDIKRIKSELLLVQKADKIIATSTLDAEYIVTLYNCSKNKIFVVTPGIDLKAFKPQEKIKAKQILGADKDRKIILYVGRIEPLKAIDVLLYAIKILHSNNPKMRICLWILGGIVKKSQEENHKELKRLKQLSESLNILTEVKFIERKHQSELQNYYNASEIVILPSHYESSGIVALEGMACGIPVIVTDTTGVSGLFDQRNSPLITSSNNPLMLAEKIKHLLTDKKEYQKVRSEVLEKIKELSWENIAEKFINIIEN